MKDLQNAVTNAMSTMVTDGTVEKIIREKLEKTIESVIDDQLRSYSEFGKALKEKIAKELSINLDQVSFAEHNHTVFKLVESIINKHSVELYTNRMAKDLEAMFERAPETISLQALINEFKNDVEYGDTSDECMTLIIGEPSRSSVWVGFNKESSKGYRNDSITETNECELQMLIDTSTGSLRMFRENDDKSSNHWLPTTFYGLSRKLFQLYCAGSVITFDERNPFDPDYYDTCYSWAN